MAAIYIEDDGNGQLYYAYTDYLGSLTALTDADGEVVERQAFGPWGNRREPDDWTSLITTPVSHITGRGYTMHSLSRIHSGNTWMSFRLLICSVRTLVLPPSKTISRTNPDSDGGAYRGMGVFMTHRLHAS